MFLTGVLPVCDPEPGTRNLEGRRTGNWRSHADSANPSAFHQPVRARRRRLPANEHVLCLFAGGKNTRNSRDLDRRGSSLSGWLNRRDPANRIWGGARATPNSQTVWKLIVSVTLVV